MPAGIRPTSNKVRGALFNILVNKVPGAACLDLFAGSGSLGLEALSRGAKSSIFVDNNRQCAITIKETIKKLGISEEAKVMQLNAMQGIKTLSLEHKFDLIFLDPPYFRDWVKKALININQCDILNHSSLAICEHHKKELMPESVGRLVTPGGNRSLSRQWTGPLQHGRRACVFIIKCFKGNGIAEYISNETT